MVSAVRGITRETYSKLGSAYIAAGGGYVIACKPKTVKGEELVATPQQWNAWRNYFFEKVIKNVGMEERGYYTVPAEWPHLFDAEWSMADDITQPMVVIERRRVEIELTAEHKRDVIKRARNRFPSEPKSQPTPKEHLEVPKEPLGPFPERLLTTDWLSDAA